MPGELAHLNKQRVWEWSNDSLGVDVLRVGDVVPIFFEAEAESEESSYDLPICSYLRSEPEFPGASCKFFNDRIFPRITGTV